MKSFTFNATAKSVAMFKIAQRDNLLVRFSPQNEVYFERKHNGYSLRWVKCNYLTKYVYKFSSQVMNFSEEENCLIVAAMMAMNIDSVLVGSNELIMLGAPLCHVDPVVIVVEEPAPKRHASNWDRAQEFGISGHAKQRQQERRPAEEPRRHTPSKPLGKWGWAAVAAVATLAVVASAMAADE